MTSSWRSSKKVLVDTFTGRQDNIYCSRRNAKRLLSVALTLTFDVKRPDTRSYYCSVSRPINLLSALRNQALFSLSVDSTV